MAPDTKTFGGKRMESEAGGQKGSPSGELSAKLTERFLRLTKSKEHGASRAVPLQSKNAEQSK